ncbi:MAG: hypothetical protein K8F59_17740 [Rhodobacteraceae bacterium]|nr:hypothetical protein [Paracoccaceae bacterium]
MAVFTGTTGADILTGSADDDILVAGGAPAGGAADVLSGGAGGDIYRLTKSGTSVHNAIIDDRGSDGAVDLIDSVGALYYSASLGYQGWTSAIRRGGDLIIDTPGKPGRFRDAAKPSFHIEIRDHYKGEAVEYMVAGGVTYALSAGRFGTIGADIVAGSNRADNLHGLDGDDWMFGNKGRDVMDLGGGNDTAFGGAGRDRISAGAGNDMVYGQAGHDRIDGGAGNDWLDGAAGKDRIRGDAGSDWIIGGDGNDRLVGGAGADSLSGDAGDDWLSGGRDGDVYDFNSRSADAPFGHDVVEDRGSKASYNNLDILSFSGFYGPSDGDLAEALARLSFARTASDMVIRVDGGASGVTISQMFDARANRYFIEEFKLNAGYWEPVVFNFLDGARVGIGDDRDYPNGYLGKANEILFGTDGDDLIFGNTGHNFIWTGAGADVLIYKENDPIPFSGRSAMISHDIVEDFDIASDRLDFREMGIALADLVLGSDIDGDALIAWNSPIAYEIASILIELRGVAEADLTADLFLF